MTGEHTTQPTKHHILKTTMRFVTTTVLAVGLITANALAAPKNNLPIIDLGYELHQALSYNTTTDIYVFSNIRYAQPPTGNLRFRAPLPPKTDRSTIQTGSEIRTCPQGVPDWQSNAFIPISRFSNGVPFTLEAWEAAINSSTPFPQSVFNGNVTEDCLFLDVHVPGEILRSAQGDKRAEAPVLVWVSLPLLCLPTYLPTLAPIKSLFAISPVPI